MGKGIRYSDEFKQEAVNQVTIHGYPVNDVAERLGINSKTEAVQNSVSCRKHEVHDRR